MIPINAVTQDRWRPAAIRDATAERRDRAAADRDAAAHNRDRLAEARDPEMGRRERIRGAEHRRHAAADRKRAHGDRQQAALDRDAAAAELAGAGIDELTSALTRRVGLPALQRELDRVQRTKDHLVLAFVDVDGLKKVNDTSGHLAGDRLLRDVSRHIKAELRPYDLIVRFGGDEFLCSLSGAALASVRRRFDHIATRISDEAGATISVGYADCGPQDSLSALIERADSALIAGRRKAGLPAQPHAAPISSASSVM